ncbi:hypothetical protein J437_LFUL006966 [Ladona fulva]|uniref:Chaoptin n=1 Tax=Ladona fulva TaxID=123851 RepID=A0A8K0KAE1_LADFU|nr:hypothetical protein J437_LFUL006966 [Ladona fulva]
MRCLRINPGSGPLEEDASRFASLPRVLPGGPAVKRRHRSAVPSEAFGGHQPLQVPTICTQLSPSLSFLERNYSSLCLCSGTDLESLTKGLSSLASWRGSAPVDELVVEGGLVGGLPGRAFTPLRVRRLLMHRSGLERLSGAALLQLEESLVELMLIEPRLRSIPAELLDTLPVLEALTIDVESEDGADTFPGRPLSVPLLHALPSLRYLRISAPQSSGLGGIFPLRDPFTLPALLSLSLHGGWAHSKNVQPGDEGLWSLLAFVANCCGGIEELNIAGNGLRLGRRLTAASPIGEIMLRSLRIFDMSDNPLGMGWEDDEDQIPQIQWLLDSAPAWIFPSLLELRVDRSMISTLPEGALRSMPHLERLSLEGNSMRSIGPDALTDLPSLHQLRLRDNLLTEESMPPAPHRRRLPFTLPTLKFLNESLQSNNRSIAFQGLDLSKNILRGGSALRRLLSGAPSIRRLDLSENAIKHLADDVFTTTPLLEFVDLSGNPVLTPSHHSMPPQLSFLKPLSRLYELRISGNTLDSDSLPVEPRHLRVDNTSFPVLPPLPGVEVLVASDMFIQKLYYHPSSPPPFSAALLPRLTILDLSGNSLSMLEPGAFSGVSSTLSGINLSRNKLHGVLRLGPPISMRSLQRLDVSHNKLEAISIAPSAAVPELKLLNASWNGIETLENGLPGVLGPSLEVLDLSRNVIISLPEDPLKPFLMLTELWVCVDDISLTNIKYDKENSLNASRKDIILLF